jgi:hypothetical protein
MSEEPTYPFTPKSTALMRAGQFFSFRLSDGRYGCGRVLATTWPAGPGRRTMFLGGLMDWTGQAPATADDLAGRGVLYQFWMHVQIFKDYRSQIDGCRALDLDGILPKDGRGVAGPGVLLDTAEDAFVRR